VNTHRVRHLLAERDFALLLAAQFLAQAADGLAQAAFADALILEPLQSGTPTRVLQLFAITLLPYSLIGPFMGVLVDRWPRRGIMVWTNVARGVVLVTFVGWSRLVPGELYIATLTLLGLGRLFLATKGASLPVLVHDHHLLSANALSGGGGMVSALAGGVVGVIAVGVVGLTTTFTLAGIVYGAAALLARRIDNPLAHPHRPLERFGEAARRIAGELWEGLVEISRRAEARVPLIAVFLLRTVGMFVAISAILVIKEEFAGEAERFGRLSISAIALGAAGVGAFLGALTSPAVGRRLHRGGLILLGFVVSGLGIVVLGGVKNIFAVIALTLLGGYGGFVTKIAVDASVQEALPDEYRGRAFALYDILYNLASVAAGGAMVLLTPLSLRPRLMLSGVFALACAALLAPLLTKAGLHLARAED